MSTSFKKAPPIPKELLGELKAKAKEALSSASLEPKKLPDISDGDYKLVFKDLSESLTAKGDLMIVTDFEIANGDFKGRRVRERSLATHSNPEAVNIGSRFLNNLAMSLGVPGGMSDLDNDYSRLKDYLGDSLIATLKLEDKEYKGKRFSRIKKMAKR